MDFAKRKAQILSHEHVQLKKRNALIQNGKFEQYKKVAVDPQVTPEEMDELYEELTKYNEVLL